MSIHKVRDMGGKPSFATPIRPYRNDRPGPVEHQRFETNATDLSKAETIPGSATAHLFAGEYIHPLAVFAEFYAEGVQVPDGTWIMTKELRVMLDYGWAFPSARKEANASRLLV
jgi:hypothetical protein